MYDGQESTFQYECLGREIMNINKRVTGKKMQPGNTLILCSIQRIHHILYYYNNGVCYFRLDGQGKPL